MHHTHSFKKGVKDKHDHNDDDEEEEDCTIAPFVPLQQTIGTENYLEANTHHSYLLRRVDICNES